MKPFVEIASKPLRAIVAFYRPRAEDEDRAKPNQRVWVSPWLSTKLVAASGAAMMWFVLRMVLNLGALAWVLPLLVLAPLWLSRPRKILVTEEAIIFWGRFGGPRRYRFSEIGSITRGERSSGVTPRTVHVMLKDAVLPENIPVEVSNYDGVLDSMVNSWRRYVDLQARGSSASPTNSTCQ